MKQLKAENLTKTYGEKSLFEHVDLTITEGERIGLIGVNGTGKSTFLNCIAGFSSMDSGTITKSKDYTTGYLTQEPVLKNENTVLEAVFAGETKSLKAMRNYESLLIELAKYPNDATLQDQFITAQAEMDARNAWDMLTEAKMILEKLGIADLDMPTYQLSGGQRKRVGLAQVLIETPDLLILDEPTNHLDYSSIKWLEDYLNRFKGAALIVTHDRYFLDRVSSHIVELDNGTIYRYIGNYEKFMEAKAIRIEHEKAETLKNANLYRRELAWMRRSPQARGTKQKARQERFASLENTVLGSNNEANLAIDFKTNRLGKEVFTLENVGKHFGDKQVLNNFSLIVQPGERIGITGNNGTGKSTLLNLLAGLIDADSGTIKVGQTVQIGYYTQQNIDMAEDKRIITYLNEISNEVTTGTGEVISVSAMLERFLFPPETHGKLISSLSGGEKRRLFLLKILMERPNVLLLDEPTNDLDTSTLTVLEDYLETFSGTVITVSHDRYFLDKVANKLLVFQAMGDVHVYYGEYSDYLQVATENIQSAKKKIAPKKQIKEEKTKAKQKTRLSFKEQREWETIEEEIATMESEIKKLNESLEHVGTDYTKATELSEQISAKEELLLEKMERWEYLSQFSE